MFADDQSSICSRYAISHIVLISGLGIPPLHHFHRDRPARARRLVAGRRELDVEPCGTDDRHGLFRCSGGCARHAGRPDYVGILPRPFLTSSPFGKGQDPGRRKAYDDK